MDLRQKKQSPCFGNWYSIPSSVINISKLDLDPKRPVPINWEDVEHHPIQEEVPVHLADDQILELRRTPPHPLLGWSDVLDEHISKLERIYWPSYWKHSSWSPALMFRGWGGRGQWWSWSGWSGWCCCWWCSTQTSQYWKVQKFENVIIICFISCQPQVECHFRNLEGVKAR